MGGRMPTLKSWLSRLGYSSHTATIYEPGADLSSSAYAVEIHELVNKAGTVRASAVCSIDGTPTICFFESEHFSDFEANLPVISRKLWSQNLVSVIVVLDGALLTARSVWNPTCDSSSLELKDASALGPWSAAEFQSGKIHERLQEWFRPELRVDWHLLTQLRNSIAQLISVGVTRTNAQALMAQVIFVSFLEHRGIVGDAYRNKHNLARLSELVSNNDGGGLRKFLRQLKTDFNGDFLQVDDSYAFLSSLPQEAFEIINRFLRREHMVTGQQDFWRYDFSSIPVELLSGIYETFLHDERDELGAFYTPRNLANLVIQQAFEGMDALPKRVYDGACGSGILLTTAFRRMLRDSQRIKRKPLSLVERIDILKKNVFGSDIHESACRITAFSLYLSLLENIQPQDISRLQDDENVKLPVLLGKNILAGETHGDFFSVNNRFVEHERFDIFISNPPWREPASNERTSYEKLCESENLPLPHRQIAAAFALHCSKCLATDGRLALILPLKLITSPSSARFLQTWLQRVRLDRIINFADLRRLLFPEAVHPCAIVTAKPRKPEGERSVSIPLDETIAYWVPKADVALAFGRIALHACDRVAVYTHELFRSSEPLRLRYWGSERDAALIKKLRRLGTIASNCSQWYYGKGFHAQDATRTPISPARLKNLRYLSASSLHGDYRLLVDDQDLISFPSNRFKTVASLGGKDGRLYSGCRVLFPDGTSGEFEIRAVFSDREFCFQSSVGAIGGSSDDRELLQFLAAYLRSQLATYFLLLTGYSVSGERPRVSMQEVRNLPFIAPKNHPDPETASKIVKQVSKLFVNAPLSLGRTAFSDFRREIDRLVMRYFLLSREDKMLVEDAVSAVATSVQPAGYTSLLTPLQSEPDDQEIDSYGRTLADALAGWSRNLHGRGKPHITIIQPPQGRFFGAVQLDLGHHKRFTRERAGSDAAFLRLLIELSKTLTSQALGTGDAIFTMPNITLSKGSSLFVIKPMRRRFWLKSAALTDSDRLVREIQSYQ
jgi:hypothetical protein